MSNISQENPLQIQDHLLAQDNVLGELVKQLAALKAGAGKSQTS